MGPNSRRGGVAEIKDIKKTTKRLLSYFKKYRFAMVMVVVLIILSSLTGVASSIFIEKLIDDYITPLMGSVNPDFSGIVRLLTVMAGVFVVGVISSYAYARIMVNVAQGILREVRDEMFSKMQSLPVGYFDSHTHGEIMSRYTNDIDSLREMISDGVPEVISSLMTVIAVFCAMLYIDVFLTLIVIVTLILMLQITKKVGGKSATYFVKQQESLGKLNGFIEEMINGQKVIKVFCHEETSK